VCIGISLDASASRNLPVSTEPGPTAFESSIVNLDGIECLNDNSFDYKDSSGSLDDWKIVHVPRQKINRKELLNGLDRVFQGRGRQGT